MKAKIASGIMLTLLLVSVLDSVAVTFVLSAGSSEGGTIDWWSMFRHYGNHTGYSTGLAPTENHTERVWKNMTNGPVYSSPAVANDTVFVGSNDSRLYAFDLEGNQKWNVSLGGPVVSSPAVDGDLVFVGSLNDSVYGINRTNGNITWNYPTGGPVYSSPAVAYGNVYVGSDDTNLYSLNELSGQKNESFPTGSFVRSSPAIDDGRIFFGADNGLVYALDAATLALIKGWPPFETGGDSSIQSPLRSSPSVADGTVFVGSLDGTVYALNETDGSKVWSNSTGEPIHSSPAVAYGKVFIGSNDSRLYALNESSGWLIWNHAIGGAVCSSPAVVNSTVFVGSMDGQVYALDEANGSVRWKCTTGSGVWSSPAVADDKVFVGSLDKYVYAFEEPPNATMTHYPDNPIICQTVTFDASNSNDSYGNITTYSWDFGDKSPIDVEKTSITYHAYTDAGPHNVNLTVTDNRGAPGSTVQLITVLEAWPMFRHDPEHLGNSTSLAPVTNQTLWVTQPIGPIGRSSPAVINSTVFIGSTDGTFSALDATNGNVIWKQALGSSVYSSPAVVDNTVFIAGDSGTISAWNVNGTQMWNQTTGGSIKSSPTVSGDMVLIGSGDDRVYAFNKTGYLLWNTTIGEIIGQVDSSPAVANGTVFVGDWSGRLTAINETDGNKTGSFFVGYNVRLDSSPTVAYGKVFFGAENLFLGDGNGGIFALDMNNISARKPAWEEEMVGKVDSSPAVADGMVFIGSSGGMYAFNATNGIQIWNNTNCSVGYSSPAVADDKVFIGTTDGKVLALRERDGALLWSYTTGGTVDCSPAVLADTLYIGSYNGNIYAFKGQAHDVAIEDVKPSQSIVAQNRTVAIDVTLWNKGSYDETGVVVTTSYDSTVFNTTILNLTRGIELPLQIPWNTTTNVPIGNYTISIDAALAPYETEYYTADNTTSVLITVQKGVHEVDVNDVESSTPGIDPAKPIPLRSVVGLGCNVTIYVSVTNAGNYDENPNVLVYLSENASNSVRIGEIPILNLLVNESRLISINWTVDGLSYGNYNISAYAELVLGETNMANNNCTGGPITITIPGDINGDFKVSLADLSLLANAYPPYPLHQWNSNADIDGSGIIGLSDIVILAQHYGQHYP
jgi:outer membrane protein assembly factor BamB